MQASPLHIIQRGNNRIACFFAEQDYRFYLYHLEELAQRFECGVPWSSYRANGDLRASALVTPHDSYVALGNQRFKDDISAMLGRRVERLRQRLRQRASQSG